MARRRARADAERAALLADAALAVAAVAGEVEMEVVAVVGVVAGAEHRGEDVAGAAVHGAQEIALGECAPPARLDVDRAAVGQHEGRRYRRRWRGRARTGGRPTRGSWRGRNRRPATFSSTTWAPKWRRAAGRHHALDPMVDGGHHRAAQQGGRAQLHRAAARWPPPRRASTPRTRWGRRATRGPRRRGSRAPRRSAGRRAPRRRARARPWRRNRGRGCMPTEPQHSRRKQRNTDAEQVHGMDRMPRNALKLALTTPIPA